MESSTCDRQNAAMALIRECLGAPAASGERFAIYQGDCARFLERLPSELFPLIVTSPPYNIGKEYEAPLPLPNYLDWCASWIKDLHRVSTGTGAFWLNLGYVAI